MPERRHFCRFHLSGQITLTDVRTRQQWHSELRDLSLQGALIRKPAQWTAQPDEHAYWLDYRLPDSEYTLRMRAMPVHQQGEWLGFRCLEIDLDSASHLKRLVELNLGDTALLQRELQQLFDYHQAAG